MEVIGRALGIASRDDYGSVGVASPGSPQGVARLSVGYVCDRASVDDVHVGWLVSGDKAIPCLSELPREKIGIRLIELATLSLYSDSWSSCGSQFDGWRKLQVFRNLDTSLS